MTSHRRYVLAQTDQEAYERGVKELVTAILLGTLEVRVDPSEPVACLNCEKMCLERQLTEVNGQDICLSCAIDAGAVF